jgi:hypothetical protein
MDVVRNFIHIVGITPEEQLPDKIRGQLIQYSDIETVYVPDDKPPAKSIFQVMFQVEVKSGRIIDTPACRTMVVDGIKSYKIMYTGESSSDNASFASVTIPYNTFIEIPKGYGDIEKVDVFVLDAYFSLLDSRRIYSYILYLVHAVYGISKINEVHDQVTQDTNPSEESIERILEVPEESACEMLPVKQISRYVPMPPEVVDDGVELSVEEPADFDAEYL